MTGKDKGIGDGYDKFFKEEGFLMLGLILLTVIKLRGMENYATQKEQVENNAFAYGLIRYIDKDRVKLEEVNIYKSTEADKVKKQIAQRIGNSRMANAISYNCLVGLQAII